MLQLPITNNINLPLAAYNIGIDKYLAFLIYYMCCPIFAQCLHLVAALFLKTHWEFKFDF